MSLRRRLRKLLLWTTALTLAIAVGGTIAAYYYATESDALAEWIAREAPKYLPGCRVKVIKAKIRPFAGRVTLDFTTIAELGEGDEPPAEVATLPLFQIFYDPWAMTKGRFEPLEVKLARPRLRLRRRADGSWNFQGLLADPWPGPKGGATPPIRVESGIVELDGGGDQPGPPLVVLRDVRIEIPARTKPDTPFVFELDAKGGMFDRLTLSGIIDPQSGRVELKKSELLRLTFPEADRARLPVEVRSALDQVGLAGGEVDLNLASLSFDPAATPPLHYEASAHLRRGVWDCPKLPFAIGDVSVHATVCDGLLRVTQADGSNGATTINFDGEVGLDDPCQSPFRVRAEIDQLELDKRLKGKTPSSFRNLWDDYLPAVGRDPSTSAGRVKVVVRASRATSGGPLALESDVDLLDVSLTYKEFAYPLDHVRGKIHATPEKLEFLDVRTLVGNRPLVMTGTVDKPGPLAEARIRFQVDALPIDSALLDAMPPNVRQVVADFKPTGTVGGTADLVRLPPSTADGSAKGKVTIDSFLHFNPESDCSITWKEMKYPVMNLTGGLEIHPDRWAFREVRGRNGQARIEVSGEVRQVRKDAFGVDLTLSALNLPFDQQLRDALPKPWATTWTTLNPTGACDLKAKIGVEPGPPGTKSKDSYRIAIAPLAQTGVNLRFNPQPVPGGPPPGPLEIRMDELTGRFVFDTNCSPPLSMNDVGFHFRGSPVSFASGKFGVQDSLQFNLTMERLEVTDLLLDEGLRRMMPRVTATFARRLDDRKLRKVQADLDLGWSGKPGESAWCRWKNGLVVLVDNRLLIGTDLALDHLQGEVDAIHGGFDGQALQVGGRLKLDSVSVFHQQITDLKANLGVGQGWAAMTDISGTVLGGALEGKIRTSLDVTPDYSVYVSVKELDLREYARSVPGQQPVKGLVSGWGSISGQGYDPHTVSGDGQASVVQGDLGTLPVVLRFFNVLKLAKDTKTAFDSAEVGFKISSGETTLDPVRLTGNAFSLEGKGTLDIRGDLEARLKVLAGRDAHHVPVLSDLTREVSGQFFAVRVFGPITAPQIRPDPLSGPIDLWRKRKNDKVRVEPGDPTLRSGLEGRLAGGMLGRFRGSAN